MTATVVMTRAAWFKKKEFPGEAGMFTTFDCQVREEEQVISLQFTCGHQDVSKSRRKKRKQVDDGAAIV